jgi:hypothetical protein
MSPKMEINMTTVEENAVKKSRTTFNAHENPCTLITSHSDQVKSHEMEMNMETMEERMYEVSEEAEEIDMPLTDRDTGMGNIATKSVIHKKEEPELVVAKSHMCGLVSVRSMDGDTFRVFLVDLLFGNQIFNIQRIFQIYKGKMSIFEKFHFEI